jgi:DNA-binding HxlR family transcriptional regulator
LCNIQKSPVDESVLLHGKKWALPVIMSHQYGLDDSLQVLGRKWALPVLLELVSGRTRFNSILGAIPGINARTLSARLSEYQETGVIRKENVVMDQPEVHYVLTAKGEEMRQLVHEISSFTLRWHDTDRQAPLKT